MGGIKFITFKSFISKNLTKYFFYFQINYALYSLSTRSLPNRP